MDIFKASERIMAMDDETWARHASPWSVYTRFTCLPLLVLAVWSRVWLGWWALVPIALALAWTWWNPRAFRPRADPDSWAAKGTYGERVFLARKDSPVPAHHLAWALGLTWVSAAGAAVLIWGLVDAGPLGDGVRDGADDRRQALVLRPDGLALRGCASRGPSRFRCLTGGPRAATLTRHWQRRP